MTIEKRKPKKEKDNMTGKLQPMGDLLGLKPRQSEEKTKSGSYIPETAKEKPQEGKVFAVGHGRVNDAGKRIAIDVEVGDIIIYTKYGGSEIKIEGEEFIIMRESDILAKKL